ncbi:MAG: DUF2585 family protein [Rubripirellula sp.]
MNERSRSEKYMVLFLVGAPVVMITVLFFMGRSWWCPQGDVAVWSLDIWSAHNSQHLFDAYSLSHIQHGIGLFVLLGLIGIGRNDFATRAILVSLIEVFWEILENTPLIINRYREATISLDYFGDSISNSLSDYVMCLLGLCLANRIGWKKSIGLFLILELTSLYWVRDSLILNIVMLVAPNDYVRDWQVR